MKEFSIDERLNYLNTIHKNIIDDNNVERACEHLDKFITKLETYQEHLNMIIRKASKNYDLLNDVINNV